MNCFKNFVQLKKHTIKRAELVAINKNKQMAALITTYCDSLPRG